MRSVIVVFLVACGAKSPSPAPPPACPAGSHVASTVELTYVHDKMCACADDECREQAMSGDALVSFDQIRTMIDDCRPSSRALRELADMKDAACSCRDAVCAGKVEQTFETWSKRNATTKGTSAEAERAGTLITDISDCLTKAQQPAAPGSPH